MYASAHIECTFMWAKFDAIYSMFYSENTSYVSTNAYGKSLTYVLFVILLRVHEVFNSVTIKHQYIINNT